MTRRKATPTLTLISWRDIPAQVVAKDGRSTSKTELPQRFQVAIDRAAMLADLAGTDEYLTEWRRASRPCGEDLEAEVASEVRRIEDVFTADVLTAHSNNGGIKP